jgi:hypothetical protein
MNSINKVFEKFEKKHKDGIMSIFGENDWIQWQELKSSILQKEQELLKEIHEKNKIQISSCEMIASKNEEVEKLKKEILSLKKGDKLILCL